MPRADTQTIMQYHIDELRAAFVPKAHVVIVLGQAGWHTTGKLRPPENLSVLPLPPQLPRTEPGRERLTVSPPE